MKKVNYTLYDLIRSFPILVDEKMDKVVIRQKIDTAEWELIFTNGEKQMAFKYPFINSKKGR